MAQRSRTGCLTCRQRKLKCSEDRPICAQCAKGNRACLASQRITFRHQQNPSMNGDLKQSENLKSFYGYKETFRQETTWLPVPAELHFVHTNNPFEDEGGRGDGRVHGAASGGVQYGNPVVDAPQGASQASYSDYATHGLEALSAVASRDEYHYAPPPATMAGEESMQAILSRSDDATQALSGKQPLRTNIDPQLHSLAAHQLSPTHVRTLSRSSLTDTSLPFPRTLDPQAQRKAEIGFLLRDFSERAGAWMDLFELGQFFAVQVPVMAKHCPLLLYSCIALSAKSLARVGGRKPVMGGQVSSRQRSSTEIWPGESSSTDGWVTKAREYYDLAVSLLRQALARVSRPSTASTEPEDEFWIENRGPLPSTESDELVAAIAVLCVYEFLDASTPEWSQHLDGAKTLFELAHDSMVPLTLPPSPISLPTDHGFGLGRSSTEVTRIRFKGPSKGRTAVFWNVARQDMLSAFINKTTTRLDPEDIMTWTVAGLKLMPDGLVYPSNPCHSDYLLDCAMPDDLICNALIWLQMKIVNFIASIDQLATGSPTNVEQWQNLMSQLQHWYEGLPDSFSPTITQYYRPDLLGLEEHWFARSMCASAMQHYHFACITLLRYRPTAPSDRNAALHSDSSGIVKSPIAFNPSSTSSLAEETASAYQGRQLAVIHHAKQILSIDLARADEATRIHAVQPLWTAALIMGSADAGGKISLEAQMWREIFVRQLRGIERDMGWASEYRVQDLLSRWGMVEVPRKESMSTPMVPSTVA